MAQHAVWEVCAQIGKSCPGGLLRSTWRVSKVASRRQGQCWNGTAVRTRKLEWGNQSGQVERLPYPAFKETRKHQRVSNGYCWPESFTYQWYNLFSRKVKNRGSPVSCPWIENASWVRWSENPNHTHVSHLSSISPHACRWSRISSCAFVPKVCSYYI